MLRIHRDACETADQSVWCLVRMQLSLVAADIKTFTKGLACLKLVSTSLQAALAYHVHVPVYQQPRAFLPLNR